MDIGKKMRDPSPHQGLLARALSMSEPQAIVEEDGIFSIQKSLETSGVELDPGLKSLVDSVLGGNNGL